MNMKDIRKQILFGYALKYYSFTFKISVYTADCCMSLVS